MFAIRVYESGGSEFVRPEVEGVRFTPAMTETDKARLFVWYKNGTSETLLSGDVYVMNENGKTVAIYRMFDGERLYPHPSYVSAIGKTEV